MSGKKQYIKVTQFMSSGVDFTIKCVYHPVDFEHSNKNGKQNKGTFDLQDCFLDEYTFYHDELGALDGEGDCFLTLLKLIRLMEYRDKEICEQKNISIIGKSHIF